MWHKWPLLINVIVIEMCKMRCIMHPIGNNNSLYWKDQNCNSRPARYPECYFQEQCFIKWSWNLLLFCATYISDESFSILFESYVKSQVKWYCSNSVGEKCFLFLPDLIGQYFMLPQEFQSWEKRGDKCSKFSKGAKYVYYTKP